MLALVPRADGERRRIALVGGEAGSGKSRLVREFAHAAASEGVLVLYGACDAVVRTPYRPFVEALDQLVRGVDGATLRADLGTAGGELARLLPDLPLRVEGLAPPIDADQDTERLRLHTPLLSFLPHRQPIASHRFQIRSHQKPHVRPHARQLRPIVTPQRPRPYNRDGLR